MKINYLKKSLLTVIVLLGLFACSFNVDKGGSTGPKEKLVVTVKSVGESNVELSWNAIEGAEKYGVLFSTKENGEYHLRNVVETTNGSISMLLPDKSYYFKLSEIKYFDRHTGQGTIYGLTSDIVEVRTKTGSLQAPLITSHTSSEYSTTLNWEAVAGATSYIIYRMDIFGGELFYRYSNGTGLSYTDDSQVEAGQIYLYKIVAYNSENNKSSTLSAEYKVVVNPPSLNLPTISYNVTSFDVGWDFQPLSGESTFERYQYLSDSASFLFGQHGGVKEPGWLKGKDVEPGKTYYYKFRIFDKSKKQASVLSKLYTITIPLPELQVVPDNLKLDNITYFPESHPEGYNAKFTVSWTPVAGCDTYYVYTRERWNDNIKCIGSVKETTITKTFHGMTSDPEYVADIMVRAINTTTRQAGPFSAPLKVKIK